MPVVDNTASVHPKADIGENVEIGPYSVIGENIKIGANTKIGPHVILDGWTTIGRNCRICAGAVIGTEPQDLKFRGDKTFVIIGDNSCIREYATINRATFEGESTVIGNNCLVMAYCHVAHNCLLEDRVIMSSFAGLAGHIHIEENAIIGGLVGVHQFVRIGRNVLVGGGAVVRQDILPYTIASGNPCRTKGMKIVGLRGYNFSPERISQLKRAYKIVFRSKFSEEEAITTLQSEIGDVTEVQHMIEFMKKSQRGLARI